MIGKGIVVIGSQFGDEGKGKVVDYYTSKSYIHCVVRFNGGSNAGHTIVVEGKKYALHLIPTGIIYGKPSFIGNGVVTNPEILDKELIQFPDKLALLKIDPKSHIVLPHHIKLDIYQESVKKKGNIAAGTTKQGIGPCYADKASRIGIRWADIPIDNIFQSQLEYLTQTYKHLSERLELPSLSDVKTYLKKYYEKYKGYLVDVGEYLESQLLSGSNILFEGAQSTLLDIDHGVYPYSTSSTCTTAGASSGTGVGIKYLNERIGVVKAYTSRVGEGPFISELDTSQDPGKHIQQVGAEFGTTTGRPRRIGWLDLVAVKYSARLNSLTGLAITKLDVIGSLKNFKVVVRYLNPLKQETTSIPPSVNQISLYTPVFKEFEGWGNISHKEYLSYCRKDFEDLPPQLKEFVSFIEEYLDIPVYLLSFGPDRELTMERYDLQKNL